MKPMAQILADINTAHLQGISSSLDVQETALMGKINSIHTAQLAELWQLAAALYNGMDPDNASGDQLASLGAITGTIRLPATSTLVSCNVVVAAGFVAQPGTMFATVSGNALNLFYNLTIVDNSASGTASTIAVYFFCQDTGPVTAPAGALTVIAQPITGWTSITNLLTGTPGANIESDASFRIRRNAELSKAATSTAAAIQSAVSAKMQPPTTSVQTTNVNVLSNPTDFTDANGVPPHAFECIALALGATANDDQLLGNLIATTKTAGDNTSGTTTVTVTDSQGIALPISFTRPTTLRIYVAISVSCTAAQYAPGPVTLPGSTAGLVAAALAALAAPFVPGQKVYAKKLADSAFRVAGVNDWTAMALDFVPSPTNTANLAVGVRQLAQLAATDVAVTLNLV